MIKSGFKGIIALIGLSALLSVFLAGCRIKREIVKEDVKMTADRELISNVINNLTKEKSIEIRFAGKANAGDESINLGGTVKIKGDEWIWASLRSSIGIDLARIFATRDSVWLNSRILRIKEKGDWNLIREYTSYPVDFWDIQGILRQGFLEKPAEDPVKWMESFILTRDKEEVWITRMVMEDDKSDRPLKELDKTVAYRIGEEDFRILETVIADEKENPSIRIDYTYADKSVGRITIEGYGSLKDYGLEMHVTGYEYKSELEYSFEKW